MGENSDHIWVVGAPGLVDIPVDLARSPGSLNDQFTLPSEADFYISNFSPVVQEASEGAYQTAELLKALQLENCSGVARDLIDAGGAGIDKVQMQLLMRDGSLYVIIFQDKTIHCIV